MTKAIFFLIFIPLVVAACISQEPNAHEIVTNAIETHGGELFEKSVIEFDFRRKHYILERDQGLYTYHRIFDDSLGTIHDIFTNDGFTRLVNNDDIEIDAEWALRYSSSVNSVAYFALLPFGLNDAAVNKKLLGVEEIKGKPYYKIRVTFDQAGGGEDFEDEFMYWFHTSSYHMDYFGYYYKNDGGGIRFRKAVNPREIGGITLSDYINYEGPAGDNDVASLALRYESGELEKLSEIVLENLEVERHRSGDRDNHHEPCSRITSKPVGHVKNHDSENNEQDCFGSHPLERRR